MTLLNMLLLHPLALSSSDDIVAATGSASAKILIIFVNRHFIIKKICKNSIWMEKSIETGDFCVIL